MDYQQIINNTLNQNKMVSIQGKFYLTVYQIEVLKKYQIPYETCNSINEIIFYIEEILNDDTNDFDDLETVSLALSETDYYQNYKK